MTNPVDVRVINLCKEELGLERIKILEKGSKFTPTPTKSSDDLREDINSFCRNLRLKEFFYRPGESESESESEFESDVFNEPLVRNKSTFTPREGRNENLDEYISFLKSVPLTQKSDKRSNINRSEYQALKSLKQDDRMIIKQADKGGALVTMDKEFYRDKILHILNNEDNYKMVDKSVDNSVIRKVKLHTTKYRDNLMPEELDYITNFEWKSSNFMASLKYTKVIKSCKNASQMISHIYMFHTHRI